MDCIFDVLGSPSVPTTFEHFVHCPSSGSFLDLLVCTQEEINLLVDKNWHTYHTNPLTDQLNNAERLVVATIRSMQ